MKASTNETQTATDENEKRKSSWAKFCLNHGINSNLLMLKMTLFVMHGATSSLLPYLTIHMQSIGITVEEIAIIYLALPFTTFLAPPITGFLVDKFGKYKPVVILTLLLNALFHHALFIIPQQEIPGVMPHAYVMRHPTTGNVEVWWSPCPSRECPEEEELNIVVDSCIDHCLLFEQNPKIEIILQQPTKSPSIRKLDDFDDLNFKVSKKKPGNLTREKSFVLMTTTTTSMDVTTDFLIRSTSEPSMKTVLKSEGNFSETKSETLDESEEESWVAGSGEAVLFHLDMHPDLGDPIEQLGIEIEDDNEDNVTDFIQRFGEKLLWTKGVNVTELDESDLRCGGLVMRHNITITEERLRELAGDCMVQKCEFLRGGPEICPPDYRESDDNTFWVYFLLRFLGTTMLSGGVTMMDPIALTMIEKYGGDFGRERLFSMFGMAIFSPITGILIDYYSRKLGYTDYSAAFYTYDILLIITAITVFLMPLGDKMPADNVFRDLWNLLKMPHVMCFIVFLFLLGNFWGFIESFLFLYLKELGAPNYLLGITITVGTISSIPFLYTAEKITRIFGHVNLIVIAFISHAGRLVGYSFIENAWWCFPFEAMEALSCHLMWVAAATYCSLLAPKNLLATLIGVLGMAHFSLGRGSGSFMGGFLIGEVGTRDAFRYMGLVAVAGGIAYKIIHHLWLKKFDAIDDDDDNEVCGESEPKFRDASTSMSQERLSLMVSKYNQVGSLTSLSRSKADIDSLIRRRSSYSISTKGGSASKVFILISFVFLHNPSNVLKKVDLIKSALEINNGKISNPMLRKDEKSAEQLLRSQAEITGPKLFNQLSGRNISQPCFIEVLNEDIEPSLLTKQKKRHHQSGLLYSLKNTGDVELDALRNYLKETERRDSIPEEDHEQHHHKPEEFMKPILESRSQSNIVDNQQDDSFNESHQAEAVETLRDK
ncbi:CLUMA_CG002068, isoform A [Clunio marinus]|uniref:CLUMA_CG002068, isoform A n=1 Tax=Clunio marinus TaxID=568069 RepID=A0A1J1HPZ9_9DIPT|nr:CLUMA_CG002068, isoform A [Clunio marinus]